MAGANSAHLKLRDNYAEHAGSEELRLGMSEVIWIKL